jgi:AhpD family alkylhydroperoxidase
MPRLFRYTTPVPKKAATAVVAAAYAQSTAELGRLAEPLTILSPAPDLLAATWATLRESQLVGRAPRAGKEAVATAVAQANRCPFCVDAHLIFTHATGSHQLADALLRGQPPADPTQAKLVIWAAATRTPDAAALSAPPFAAELAAEYVGTALAYHFVTRMVSALLAETFLPTGPRLSRVARRVAGLALGRSVRRERRPGDSLALLAAAPAGAASGWAANTPIGSAFAALRAAATTGAALLTEPGRAAVVGTVARWDGAHPPLAGGWLDEPLATLPDTDRPGARLALLAALAPYRITDADVAAWHSPGSPGSGSADADLVRLLAFGAITAVDRVEAWTTAHLAPDTSLETLGARPSELPVLVGDTNAGRRTEPHMHLYRTRR